jgi:hypothetical protein
VSRRLPVLIYAGLILTVLSIPLLRGYSAVLLTAVGLLFVVNVWQELKALP